MMETLTLNSLAIGLTVPKHISLMASILIEMLKCLDLMELVTLRMLPSRMENVQLIPVSSLMLKWTSLQNVL